jgi:hypothetical protein
MDEPSDAAQHQMRTIEAFVDAVAALMAAVRAQAIPVYGTHFQMQIPDPDGQTTPVNITVSWPTFALSDDAPPPVYRESPPPPYSGRLWTIDELLQPPDEPDEPA